MHEVCHMVGKMRARWGMQEACQRNSCWVNDLEKSCQVWELSEGLDEVELGGRGAVLADEIFKKFFKIGQGCAPLMGTPCQDTTES
jgi:hypothetical protein